ncbi:hypothetical protein FACS189473_5760 [Spirochaetia bacterium]|nr:hypothetical protein FACS189473_5760 [Spirochaetia bacterium]
MFADCAIASAWAAYSGIELTSPFAVCAILPIAFVAIFPRTTPEKKYIAAHPTPLSYDAALKQAELEIGVARESTSAGSLLSSLGDNGMSENNRLLKEMIDKLTEQIAAMRRSPCP